MNQGVQKMKKSIALLTGMTLLTAMNLPAVDQEDKELDHECTSWMIFSDFTERDKFKFPAIKTSGIMSDSFFCKNGEKKQFFCFLSGKTGLYYFIKQRILLETGYP